MNKFILATRNRNKIYEISKILHNEGIEVVGQVEAGYDADIPETGNTFEENALIKARAIFNLSGAPSIADDSGLEVDALGGMPGIYSARYAGEGAGQQALIDKILTELKDVRPNRRTARFICVLACVRKEYEFTVSGICEGEILECERGVSGFGYDPIFYFRKIDKTFAELSMSEKNEYSHRGKAVKAFCEKLKSIEKEVK